MSLARLICTAVHLRRHRSRRTCVPTLAHDRRERLSAPSRGYRVHVLGARATRHRAICHALVLARLALGAQ